MGQMIMAFIQAVDFAPLRGLQFTREQAVTATKGHIQR
jgi:hypothetical protein